MVGARADSGVPRTPASLVVSRACAPRRCVDVGVGSRAGLCSSRAGRLWISAAWVIAVVVSMETANICRRAGKWRCTAILSFTHWHVASPLCSSQNPESTAIAGSGAVTALVHKSYEHSMLLSVKAVSYSNDNGDIYLRVGDLESCSESGGDGTEWTRITAQFIPITRDLHSTLRQVDQDNISTPSLQTIFWATDSNICLPCPECPELATERSVTKPTRTELTKQRNRSNVKAFPAI